VDIKDTITPIKGHIMTALQVIELFAGNDPQGQPIVERLAVRQNEDDSFQLVKSPVFIRGIASGDTVKLLPDSKEGLEQINEQLTPKLEKLGGELDLENARVLVYSIHVSCGFKTIEALLNQYVGTDEHSMWVYGNVYDPADGTTPLNWWHDILKPE